MAWPAAPSTSRAARRTSTRPAVGDTFDFVTKYKTLAAIAEKYNLKLEECAACRLRGPEGELVYLPAGQADRAGHRQGARRRGL